jgi:hypothetical protein
MIIIQKNKITQKALATWAKEHFTLPKEPTQPTICKILKEQSISGPANSNINQKRMRSSKYPRLEEMLEIWMASCEGNNYPITWDTVVNKANFFAEPLKIQDFAFSNGWIDRFRKRSGFRGHRLHGESNSTDKKAISEHIPHIRNKIAAYVPSDVYNMDETALYYRSAPKTTISRNNVNGTKENKSRFTIALTVNADASDRRELLIIGKSSKPRCFGKNKTGNFQFCQI